ncbi:MAG: hypothetical protein ACKV2T_37140 [Kofleriaceae bacterium]
MHRESRLHAILASGLASSLKAPTARATLGTLALAATSDDVSRTSLDLLAQVLASAKTWPALSPITYDKSLVDPAVLELVLSRGLAIAAPKGDVTTFRFSLTAWVAREYDNLAEDHLVLVAAHPWLGAVLVATMLPGRDRKRLGPTLDRAARLAPASSDVASSTHAKQRASKIVGSKTRASATPAGIDRVFAGIDAHAAELAAFGTLDVFVPPKDSSDPAPGELWLHAIARPSVIARCPRVSEAVRAITPERLLRNTLHIEELAPTATDEDARRLVDLAAPPVREPDTVMNYGNMQAVLVARAPETVEASPELKAAIEALVGPRRASAPSSATTPSATHPLSAAVPSVPTAKSMRRSSGAVTGPTSKASSKRASSKSASSKRAGSKSASSKRAGSKRASSKRASSKSASSTRVSSRSASSKRAGATTASSTSAGSKTAVAGTKAKGTKATDATKGARRKAPDLHARIAELASAAASLAPATARLHARLAAAALSDGAVASGGAVALAHDEDFPSVAHLLDHSMPWWTLDAGIEMPQQILDTGRYLLANDAHGASFATPAPSEFPWERLGTRAGELVYRLLAPATSKARRAELAELLHVWLDSGIPRHLKALRVADFMAPESMVQGMDRRFSTRLATWGPNRYFVRYFRPLGDGRAGVRVLEHTHDGVFRVPDGVQLGEHVMLDVGVDDAAIRKALELLESRGPVPFDARVSEGVSQRTGLSVAAATLVWTAGYEPWLVGEKKRAELQLERDALDAAEQELAKPRLREIYARAMPADPADMYKPDALADRVAEAWRVYRAEALAWEARHVADKARAPN